MTTKYTTQQAFDTVMTQTNSESNIIMKKITQYVLDVKLWRCGGDIDPSHLYTLGEGDSSLLNEEGYMCCLGQFALQADIPKDQLLDKLLPCCLYENYDSNFIDCTDRVYDITLLAQKLININDSTTTTVKSKISQIREVLDSYGITLHVINEEVLQ